MHYNTPTMRRYINVVTFFMQYLGHFLGTPRSWNWSRQNCSEEIHSSNDSSFNDYKSLLTVMICSFKTFYVNIISGCGCRYRFNKMYNISQCRKCLRALHFSKIFPEASPLNSHQVGYEAPGALPLNPAGGYSYLPLHQGPSPPSPMKLYSEKI